MKDGKRTIASGFREGRTIVWPEESLPGRVERAPICELKEVRIDHESPIGTSCRGSLPRESEETEKGLK